MLLADALSQTATVADGFHTYGPYIYGLALTIIALTIVFSLLLVSKSGQIDREGDARKRSEDRAETAEAQLLMTQERRVTDLTTYSDKLAALAKEGNATQIELAKGYFELARAVQDKIQEPKKKALPKDDPILSGPPPRRLGP